MLARAQDAVRGKGFDVLLEMSGAPLALGQGLQLLKPGAQAALLGLGARGTPRQRAGLVLALGGALFLCSDALLASNRFAAPLPMASLWILASYWLAQWCIASWLDAT